VVKDFPAFAVIRSLPRDSPFYFPLPVPPTSSMMNTEKQSPLVGLHGRRAVSPHSGRIDWCLFQPGKLSDRQLLLRDRIGRSYRDLFWTAMCRTPSKMACLKGRGRKSRGSNQP
jgi:hypothetical protein